MYIYKKHNNYISTKHLLNLQKVPNTLINKKKFIEKCECMHPLSEMSSSSTPNYIYIPSVFRYQITLSWFFHNDIYPFHLLTCHVTNLRGLKHDL